MISICPQCDTQVALDSEGPTLLFGCGHSFTPERAQALRAERCGAILRAYGIAWPTQAEQRAYAGVLDRMGAFSIGERAALRAGGYL